MTSTSASRNPRNELDGGRRRSRSTGTASAVIVGVATTEDGRSAFDAPAVFTVPSRSRSGEVSGDQTAGTQASFS